MLADHPISAPLILATPGASDIWDRNLAAKIISRYQIKFHQAKFPIQAKDYVSVPELPFRVGSIVRIPNPIQLSVKY